MLVIIFGLPGTGKSFLAERLAKELGWKYISSDRLRKKYHLQSKYDADSKEKVYHLMIDEARQQLEKNENAVLDATFSTKKYLEEVKNLCSQYKSLLKLIEMTADEETIRQRVNKKRKFSEADFEVYQKLKEESNHNTEIRLTLDSSQMDIKEMIAMAKRYLLND